MLSNEELYREVILDHSQHPRNFGPMPHATHEASGVNENCGDQLTIRAIINDNVASDLKFEGEGCALCKASASLMTDRLKKKPLASIATEINNFKKALLAEHDPSSKLLDQLGDLAAVLGARKFPARIKCVLLAWDLVEQWVKKVKKNL